MRYGKAVKRRDKLASNSSQNNSETTNGASNSQHSKIAASSLIESSSINDLKSFTSSDNNFHSAQFRDETQTKVQVYEETVTFSSSNNPCTMDDISATLRGGIENDVRAWFGQEPSQHHMSQCEPNNSVKQYDVTENSFTPNQALVSDSSHHEKRTVEDGNNYSTPYPECSERFVPSVEQELRTPLMPSPTRSAKNTSSLNDNQGRRQELPDSAAMRSDFVLTNGVHQQRQQSSLRDNNVSIDGILCELPKNSIPIKLELSFSATSQNQHESVDHTHNRVAEVNKPVLNDIQHDSLINQEVQKSAVSQLEELYQFEQDYFYRAGLEEDSACHISLQNTEPNAESRLPRDDIQDVVNNSAGDRNKLTNERLADQKSILVKQSPTTGVNNNNNDTDASHNNCRDSLLKPTQNDASRHSSGSRKQETCQGYNAKNENDDRLKQLSLRFSADANKKPLVSLNVDDVTRDDSVVCSSSSSAPLRVGNFDNPNRKTKHGRDIDEKNIGGCKFDAYSFELDNVVKAEEQVEQDRSLFDVIQGNKIVEGGEEKKLPTSNSTIQDSSIQNLDESSLSASEELISNQNEINDLIERISSAHRDTCTLLKARVTEISKRQSISSLPTIAGSQYCRYRNSLSLHPNKPLSENSPSSSLLNGSAGSSASSVSSGSSSSGGSPINNNQYITSSPTLSPSINSSTATKTCQSSITPYLESSSSSSTSTSSSGNHQHVETSGTNISNNNKQESSNDLSSQSEIIEEYKISLWQEYALLVNPSIKQVVEFAKQVPGFLALDQLDQMLLIKSGFFEIWLVTIAGMFNCSDSTLTFADGTYIDREQLDTMFDKNFSTIAFNFSISFNQLCLDDTEISLISAIILLQPSKLNLMQYIL